MLAGCIGFNKDMGALDSVLDSSQGDSTDKADILLRSTHEVMQRLYEPWRQHKLYKGDVRKGNVMLARFQVCVLLIAVLHATSCQQDSKLVCLPRQSL